MNEINIPATTTPKMTFEELHRRRRQLETEVAIQEMRLIDAIRNTMTPSTMVRSVSSFAFDRLFSRYSIVGGILQGFRSVGWITRVMRRFMHR